MEPQAFNQEILLFTGSSFFSRELERNSDDSNNDHSGMEELERACWDGMLYEMLPEVTGNIQKQKNNYIWNTASGVNFLCINLGTCPTTTVKETSIDPYFSLWGAGKTN